MGIIETKGAFYRGNLSFLKTDINDFEEIPKSKENSFIKEAKNLDVVKLYLWFAEFPVSRYEDRDGNHIVEFYDLRFGLIPTKIPFLLKLIFDENGSLNSISLSGRAVGERFRYFFNK